MKKSIPAVAAALVVLLALSGCGQSAVAPSGSATAENSASGSTSSTSTPTTAATAKAPPYNYSEGLTDSGYLVDVTPSDYVTLPAYKGVSLSAADLTVTDAEVQTEIDTILSGYATKSKNTSRAVADGDTVNIDYVGTVDGVAFTGGDTGGKGTTVTIGTTQYIDNFLQQLIGHNPGETFDVTVTFPDPYTQDTTLSGKQAVFSTTINYIEESTPATLDDAFVKSYLSSKYGGCTTVAEFKTAVQDSLTQSKQYKTVWNQLLSSASFSTLPQAAVDIATQHAADRLSAMAASYGVTVDTILQSSGYATIDDYKNAATTKASSENRVQRELLAQAIAEDAGLTVTDADISTLVGAKDISSYVDYYGAGYLHQQALYDKIVHYVLDHCTKV
ncbi:MAG: FKBP-type peptidyl-prolyl cis-trans isomerase [Pygmaiobacter sp.]|nr:FKBP-type peptidyl-prolyl cis-trans isomerase [Pygmaiobacter sp.]